MIRSSILTLLSAFLLLGASAPPTTDRVLRKDLKMVSTPNTEMMQVAPFTVRATVGGDVNIAGNPNFRIEEGGEIRISIEALSTEAEGQTFDFNFSLEGSTATLGQDFIQTSSNNTFTVRSAVNPDGVLSFSVPIDEVVDPGEEIQIKFLPDPNGDYVWENAGFDGSFTIGFGISISDVEPGTVRAILDNTGAVEGAQDTFTLTLEDFNGSPWINDTGSTIEFPIEFKNEIEGTPLPPDNDNFKFAEDDDYSLSQGGDVKTGTIAIPPGASSGQITVFTNTDVDDDREYYSATISQPLTGSIDFSIPGPLQATIIDGKFYVTVIPIGKVELITGDPEYETLCCRAYTIQEGDELVFEFKAEKGVPINTEYKSQIILSGLAEENVDYINNDNDDVLDGVVKEGAFDNRLRIDILTDAVLNENLFDDDDDPNTPPIALPGEELNVRLSEIPNPGEIEPGFVIIGELSSSLSDRSFDVFLVDVIPASIEATVPTAQEDPLTSGEFTVRLSGPNNTGNTIAVNYQIAGTSTAQEGVDFEALTGTVLIPDGQQEAIISIVPINDSSVESDEAVDITLVSGKGYSISDPSTARVIIKSEDLPTYVATIEATDDTAEENPLSTATFTVRLDSPNDSGQMVQVNYTIVDSGNNPAQPADYQPLSGSVNIAMGAQSATITITPVDDTEEENTETLTLQLTDGDLYEIGEPGQATIQIRSDEFDQNTIDSKALQVTAESATCVGKAEGAILIRNTSSFQFTAFIDGPDGAANKALPPNDEVRFENLELGTYVVTFDNLTNPALTSPSFVVNIEALEDLKFSSFLADTDNLEGKIRVSGSTSYRITTELGVYNYTFDTPEEQVIALPLRKGLNSLRIEGAAACQGVVHKQFLVDELRTVPNPTTGPLEIVGFSTDREVQMVLVDSRGKAVRNNSRPVKEGALQVDLSGLASGIYYGRILNEDGSQSQIKIIKH